MILFMNVRRQATVNARRLAQNEWPQAFPVISQFRSLDEAEFFGEPACNLPLATS
ncbi:hypothetical protein AWB75_05483 [Caballeronia catudaia]|uniref:Uncharacterized protein n=1 Tax=Caballeronia catudaia TaxID=1777136 RepID=A0A158CNU7_9BURK|nr:hypothetical protein AWB75_05483 [Caballeronia catudaia]